MSRRSTTTLAACDLSAAPHGHVRGRTPPLIRTPLSWIRRLRPEWVLKASAAAILTQRNALFVFGCELRTWPGGAEEEVIIGMDPHKSSNTIAVLARPSQRGLHRVFSFCATKQAVHAVVPAVPFASL